MQDETLKEELGVEAEDVLVSLPNKILNKYADGKISTRDVLSYVNDNSIPEPPQRKSSFDVMHEREQREYYKNEDKYEAPLDFEVKDTDHPIENDMDHYTVGHDDDRYDDNMLEDRNGDRYKEDEIEYYEVAESAAESHTSDREASFDFKHSNHGFESASEYDAAYNAAYEDALEKYQDPNVADRKAFLAADKVVKRDRNGNKNGNRQPRSEVSGIPEAFLGSMYSPEDQKKIKDFCNSLKQPTAPSFDFGGKRKPKSPGFMPRMPGQRRKR